MNKYISFHKYSMNIRLNNIVLLVVLLVCSLVSQYSFSAKARSVAEINTTKINVPTEHLEFNLGINKEY